MIKNSLGDQVEFDMSRARGLSKRFDRWAVANPGNLPMGVCDIIMSVWGYDAALDEIEDLRRQLHEATISRAESD